MFRRVLILVILVALPAIVNAKMVVAAPLPGRASTAINLPVDPSKPLYDVGISGGFTGASMVATVYGNGQVRIVRRRGAGERQETIGSVPLVRSGVLAVARLAERNGALAIPKATQDRPYGADIPVLSFRLYTTGGVKSAHVMGVAGSHLPGTGAFFPIWALLHALAGYPSQLG
jgi:hypothetical protein